MVARTPPGSKEIIELLSRLKAETPEYPASMLAARKAAFLRQAATLTIQGKGQGGEGGQQGGSGGTSGSGTALGGSTTAQGIILKAAIGFGLVATILIGLHTGNYLIRDQVSGQLQEDIVAVIGSPEPRLLSVLTATPIPTEYEPVMATPEITITVAESSTTVKNVIDDAEFIDDIPNGAKENPGLHLGQATGTPAAPGHGNPGNINKPDKPDKPDKPGKKGN